MALLRTEKVPVLHADDTGPLTILLPLLHGGRPLSDLLCMLLHRWSTATVRVAFPKYRIHGRSQNLGIGCLGGLFLSILWVGGVVGNVVTLGLELCDALQQLRDGGGDVGQLDDVPLRGLN